MIKIKRSECPKSLIGSPASGTRYNSTRVVNKLWVMQHEKCCYCEAKIPKKGHLKAVEHFRPQKIFKKRKNDWKNLLLACSQCNGKKSDKFPIKLSDNSNEPKVIHTKNTYKSGKPLIIDPSNPGTDPEEHIDFIVDDSDEDYGLVKAKDEFGHKTIDVIGLSDSFHTKQRRNHLRTMNIMYNTLLLAKDQDNDFMLTSQKDHFRMLMSAKNEYAAFVRAYARHKKLDRFDLEIPVGEQI